MNQEKYHPEKYWTEVGKRIAAREDGKNVIAGDDEPYYRYKRERFLALLNEVDFSQKSVLEIGCGPGGNLLEIYKHNPSKLVGVDISEQMVELAKQKMPKEIEIIKINGTELPFPDNAFDIVITATVLQHNTDETMLKQIMKELCRVSSKKIYLFEKIEKEIKGDELCYGRPVNYYSKIMKENGFKFELSKFINIRSSYYISGTIRKLLNPKTRREGEPLNKISIILQKFTLLFSKQFDKVFKSKCDIARLEYTRNV